MTDLSRLPGSGEQIEQTRFLGLDVSPFVAATTMDVAVDELPGIARETGDFDEAAEQERHERIFVREVANSFIGPTTEPILTEPAFREIPTLERLEWWRGQGLDEPASEHLRWLLRGRLDEAVLAHLHPDEHPVDLTDPRPRIGGTSTPALRAFLPMLSPEVLEELRASLPSPLPQPFVLSEDDGDPGECTSDDALVAGILGGREEEIAALLEELPAGIFREPFMVTEPHLEHLCLAATPADRVRLAKRTRLVIPFNANIAMWLLNTGAEGLAVLTSSIEGQETADHSEILASRLAVLVHGPAVAGLFARLASRGRGAIAAGQWLRSHPRAVLASNTPVAYAVVVASVLRGLDDETLRGAQDEAKGAAAQAISAILAERAVPVLDVTDGSGLGGEWAAAAPDQTAAKKLLRKVPDWLDVERLPSLVLRSDDGEQRLDADATRLLLATLVASGGAVKGLAALVRERASESSRDDFARALLTEWLQAGAPAKDKWLLPATGVIGSSGYALTLAPLVREWPSQKLAKRAASAVDTLRTIGTDVALVQLAGFAATVRTASLRKAAEAAMQEVAQERGLSRDELEDRIVPDGGLDPQGWRRLDLGPRAVLVGLRPDGSLSVREEGADGRPTGPAKSALPKATAADDATLVAEAKRELGQLRKTLTALAGPQTRRLEQAMVTGRSWTPREHHELIAAHPVLRSLLAGIVWEVVRGVETVATVRIDEAGSLVDASDETVDVAAYGDVRVRIAHPASLPGDVAEAWGVTLGGHELSPAFRQLDRPVRTLPDGQGNEAELAGLPAAEVPALRLVGALRDSGWLSGTASSGGTRFVETLPFAGAGLTAVLVHSGLLAQARPAEQDDVAVQRVVLVRGAHEPGTFGDGSAKAFEGHELVPWVEAPAAVVSEVLASLEL